MLSDKEEELILAARYGVIYATTPCEYSLCEEMVREGLLTPDLPPRYPFRHTYSVTQKGIRAGELLLTRLRTGLS